MESSATKLFGIIDAKFCSNDTFCAVTRVVLYIFLFCKKPVVTNDASSLDDT